MSKFICFLMHVAASFYVSREFSRLCLTKTYPMAEQQISTEQSQASKHADNSHASVSVVTDQSDKFSTPGSKMIKLYDLQSSIKEKINASTKRDTKFYDIAQPYDVLKELNVQVTPQLEEIDFYAGDRIPDQHDYAPMSALHQQLQEKFRQKVELSQILNNFHEGQICFVGPAGSGKTTLLKAISRDVMEGKYENLKHIEIVHFVKCRGFRANDKVTSAELLFYYVNPELNKDEMNGSLEFAKYNPNKILFVIDSLDTLPYALDGEHHVIGLYEEASPATILWNLLTNKLLPGCRSITSSREHTIRKYEGDLRANKFIALAGLTEESMKQIIAGYLDEIEAEEIMSYLRSHHSLLSLCETPVFLVFTLIGWKYVSEFTPRTMSGILVLLLQSLQRSSHANAENIEDVINKMKELAFTGTKEGRVLFQIHELAQYDLEEKEVTDVAVLAPGGRSQRLLKGDSVLFFCHQSIQETLTAFHIAEMKLYKFKTFIADQLHTPHYCVVRRILCGIMLDENVTKAAGQLLKENDFQVKKSQLLKSLRRKLARYPGNADQLELFISLYEAGDGVKDIIASSVNEIDLYNLPLLLSDVHAIGSIMHHCTQLQTVKLSGCSLTSSSIQVLASSINNSNVKIRKLGLGNNELHENSMSHIGKLVIQCEVQDLDLCHCGVSLQHLQELQMAIGSYQFKTLNIELNVISPTQDLEDILSSLSKKPAGEIYPGKGISFNENLPFKSGHRVFWGKLRGSSIVDPEKVAVKVLSRNQGSEKSNTREIQHLINMEHENVVKYRVSCDFSYRCQPCIALVIELCETDTLYDIVKKDLISYEKKKYIAEKIMRGLAHIHSNQILHRDLKPQNVLMSRTIKHVPKITDFGLSKEFTRTVSKSNDIIGTDGWGSPEHYKEGATMSVESDIYSAGLVFYFVLSNGKHAFGDHNHWRSNIVDGKHMDLSGLQCPNPEIARDLITKMLEHEPDNRPTAEEVLEHLFFWNDKEKLEFLCEVSDCFDAVKKASKGKQDPQQAKKANQGKQDPQQAKKANQGKQDPQQAKKKCDAPTQEIVGVDWVQKMKLNEEERKKIPNQTDEDPVYEKANEKFKKGPRYNHASVTSLLRFIRNRYIHYKDDNLEKEIFTNEQGFWKFFSTRFPKLFSFIYDLMKNTVVFTEYSKRVADNKKLPVQ